MLFIEAAKVSVIKLEIQKYIWKNLERFLLRQLNYEILKIKFG